MSALKSIIRVTLSGRIQRTRRPKFLTRIEQKQGLRHGYIQTLRSWVVQVDDRLGLFQWLGGMLFHLGLA